MVPSDDGMKKALAVRGERGACMVVLAFAQRKVQGALMTSFRFPTGEKHNYPHAEYASGAVEYGFTCSLTSRIWVEKSSVHQ